MRFNGKGGIKAQPSRAKWKQAERLIKARRRHKSRMGKRPITTIWQLMEPHTGNQANG